MADSASDRLLQAAADGSLEGVKEALRQGADVNARAQFGDTALNLAAEHGHKDVVQCLLDKGADIHNLGGADKTPIMNAAFAGNIGIVRLLLEKGARVTDDLLASVQLKVGILEENAEAGMVRPEAVEAWKRFLDTLVAARQEPGQ
jgi:ankyrin repeat protein